MTKPTEAGARCPRCGAQYPWTVVIPKCTKNDYDPWHTQPERRDEFTVQEEAAIGELSRDMEISRIAVLRQGLRILQAVQAGMMELRDLAGKDKAEASAARDGNARCCENGQFNEMHDCRKKVAPLPDAEPGSAGDWLQQEYEAANEFSTLLLEQLDKLSEDERWNPSVRQAIVCQQVLAYVRKRAVSRDRRVREQLVRDYDVRPFDKLPEDHAKHVEHWLTANQQKTADVRWSLYPLGMVGRWIERAEPAVLQLDEAREELSKCDDVRLDVPLAEGIFDLQRHRESLEGELAEAQKVLEKINTITKTRRDLDALREIGGIVHEALRRSENNPPHDPDGINAGIREQLRRSEGKEIK